MSDKPLLKDGVYFGDTEKAEIRSSSDGINFVECTIFIHQFEKEYVDFPYKRLIWWKTDNDNEIRLRYRLPLTKGAFEKTYESLVAMGATMKSEENILHGVGTKCFYVNCINLECHENEAPGKYRTYVKSVESL